MIIMDIVRIIGVKKTNGMSCGFLFFGRFEANSVREILKATKKMEQDFF